MAKARRINRVSGRARRAEADRQNLVVMTRGEHEQQHIQAIGPVTITLPTQSPAGLTTTFAPADLRESGEMSVNMRFDPIPKPWPHDVDNADLMQSVDDLLAACQNNPLAPILMRLPILKPRQVGEVVNPLVKDAWLRCIGGPLATKLVPTIPQPVYAMDDADYPEAATHHYVEKAATWNGLSLRWHEWEQRPASFPARTVTLTNVSSREIEPGTYTVTYGLSANVSAEQPTT